MAMFARPSPHRAHTSLGEGGSAARLLSTLHKPNCFVYMHNAYGWIDVQRSPLHCTRKTFRPGDEALTLLLCRWIVQSY